jgi:ATP-dependent Clp protease protease subunit
MSEKINDANESFLLKNRYIYVNGEFNESLAKTTCTELLKLATESTGPIVLIIDSYGGQARSFMAIHDTMKLIDNVIATICIGKAMSAGIMLLMSGTIGHRYITPNSSTLYHSLSGGTYGKISEMEADVIISRSLQKQIDKLVLKYTKINKKQLNSIKDVDTYYNAQDSVKYGFCDKVINSIKEIK